MTWSKKINWKKIKNGLAWFASGIAFALLGYVIISMRKQDYKDTANAQVIAETPEVSVQELEDKKSDVGRRINERAKELEKTDSKDIRKAFFNAFGGRE